ncbi:hypothetical protein TruAng_006966 [Truncatella angustata]|nr:hypothetical protein TruAng_006966 [Truncatella angustata]
MLAARDQENLVARHHSGTALKQQQNGQLGTRYPKTPINIPLNDENAGHLKGAKSVLGNRTKGNENAMASKGFKGQDKSNFVTPMQPRNRAVLGDKTTNAKAQALQTVNVKSAIKEIQMSKGKAPTTVKPKQKQPQVETQKLLIHAQVEDPLSEEEPEYCPPRPKDLPYESDVFPDGVLTFDMLKPENRMKGFYQYYFDPIGEDGVSKSEREEREATRKALEEADRKIKEDFDNFEWPSVQDEIDEANNVKPLKSKPTTLTTAQSKAKEVRLATATRRPLSSLTSRTAASALTMDDATKSLQRRTLKPVLAPVARKKAASFTIPRLTGNKSAVPQPPAVRRTPMANIEANSRTTLGYNKGRAAASALLSGTTRPGAKRAPSPFKPKAAGLPRSATTASTDSDMTITPSRFAKTLIPASVDDELWKERVPFLSIFHPEDDDDDCDFAGGPLPELEDDDFQMQLPE